MIGRHVRTREGAYGCLITGLIPFTRSTGADHRVPLARGGESTLSNGLCAGWAANFEKSDRQNSHACWFLGGRPTAAYLSTHRTVPRAIERQLRRFSRLHYSDTGTSTGRYFDYGWARLSLRGGMYAVS